MAISPLLLYFDLGSTEVKEAAVIHHQKGTKGFNFKPHLICYFCFMLQ